MQYFQPDTANEFVGDPMPYWHDGTFHLFYLLDQDHHAANGGLGGHQWAHASTRDLVEWTHHPLAIPLGKPSEVDWTSICTGSVFEHDGTFYAFYATRLVGSDERVTEAVCLSTSDDCVSFAKSPDNPILHPSDPYRPGGFRDPCVFEFDGAFHMLVTAELADDRPATKRQCVAHYTSTDLRSWDAQAPVYVPGGTSAAECPDWFAWNEFYYLTYLEHGTMTYRVSRGPFGPWRRPPVDAFDGAQWSAAKSAQYGDDRRIAVGFLRWRDSDHGPTGYAGNAVFREIRQQPGGSLTAMFPAEMSPPAGDARGIAETRLAAPNGTCSCKVSGGAPHARIRCVVEPEPVRDDGLCDAGEFGLVARATDGPESGYEIRFAPERRVVSIDPPGTAMAAGGPRPDASLHGVPGLDSAFALEVVLCGDIIDVCVDGRRCLVARYPDWRGSDIHLFSDDRTVVWRDIEIAPLRPPATQASAV